MPYGDHGTERVKEKELFIHTYKTGRLVILMVLTPVTIIASEVTRTNTAVFLELIYTLTTILARQAEALILIW